MGFDTPQDIVSQGLMVLWTLLGGVSGVVGHCSVASDTLQDFVLRDIRSRWQIKTPLNQTKKR